MRKTVLSVLIAFCTIVLVQAQNYKLHSVFIYSFTRYVQWPDAYNNGDFTIHVLGESPITEELKAMAQSRKVGERTIKIIKINSPAEIKPCNILFVPSSRSAQLNEVINKVSNQSILIITEDPGLGAKGSNINFINKDGKLAFELNQSAVNKQGFKVSVELTRLAILI